MAKCRFMSPGWWMAPVLLVACRTGQAPQAPDAGGQAGVPPAADAAPVHDATIAAPADSSPTTDSAPTAADAAPADPAALAACEAALARGWTAQPPTTGVGSASARASYSKVIGKLMADFQIPGGAVAVARNGKLVLALGLGISDTDEAAHPDQLFRVASLSKQITASAILLLVERGQLGLDDKVFGILGEYQPLPGRTRNPQLEGLTVRQLLQHTGGWNRDSEAVGDPMFASANIAAAFGAPGPADGDLIIRYMLDKPLSYAPGSTYCYSNFGYTLLGRIIEVKSGMAYPAFVQKNVLGPARVSEMAIGRSRPELRADGEVHYFDLPGDLAARSVFPDVSGPVPWPYGGFYLEPMAPHGAWIASPIDFVRLQLGIDGSPTPADVIAPASRALMVADPQVPSCTTSGGTSPAVPGYWYGFGLQVNKYANTWHTGSLPGTATEDVMASNGFSWAAFFNRRPASSDFWGRLDQDLWTALDGVTTWTAADLFDAYPARSIWLSASDYQTEAGRQKAAGRWPLGLEGRLTPAGTVEYRARFASLAPGVKAESEAELDCLALGAADRAHAAGGFALSSLHSYRDQAGHRRYQVTWTSGF
jgi:CubicO group peptidase (beta-lactamase class C family)